MLWGILLNAFGGTLLAIALTVAGAIGAFIKWGGNKALDEWLKKRYKAWELEAEKPYKEDFLRLEHQLKLIAAREQKEFELAHPERVTAAKELHRLCKDLYTKVVALCMLRAFTANGRNQAALPMLKEANFNMLETIAAPNKYMSEHSYDVNADVRASVEDFGLYASVIIANENKLEAAEFSKVNETMKQKLENLGLIIRKLIGGEKEKSLQE